MSTDDQSKADRKEKRALRARNLEAFFSSTSVLGSENAQEYKALYRTLKSELPRGSALQMYRVKQVADSIWNSLRTTRLQAGAIDGARIEALIKLLTPKYGSYLEEDKKKQIAINYFSGSDDDKSRAAQIVVKLGITRDMIDAFAMQLQIQTVMALDKMRGRSEQSIDANEQKLMGPPQSKKRKNKSKASDSDTLPSDDTEEISVATPSRGKNSWN